MGCTSDFLELTETSKVMQLILSIVDVLRARKTDLSPK